MKCNGFRDYSLAGFFKFTDLTYLNLNSCDQLGLTSSLSYFPKLKFLDISNCRVPQSCIGTIYTLTTLECLSFHVNPKVNVGSLSCLGKLTALSSMYFSEMRNLTQLLRLKVDITGNESDDYSTHRWLAPLTNLTSLSLCFYHTMENRFEMQYLSEHIFLKELNINDVASIPEFLQVQKAKRKSRKNQLHMYQKKVKKFKDWNKIELCCSD
eukprot:TRINITY_DN1454_c0_g1_i5.p1 TRINITY_DN1454_c0_g1~~TRINITY_DN1454_c0_g1_i5.p1  ORF type:complete len:211 (+),score=15.18 TRINITY_DN1454_c0_g1_i5:450-1082(+)